MATVLTCPLRRAMRRLTIVLAVFATLAPAVSYAQSTDVSVDELLAQIKKVLSRVDSASVGSLPPLSRVTLNLKTVLEKESGGKFSLWIVSFGKEVSEQVVQTVSLELAPPVRGEESRRTSGRDPASVSISEALAEAIIVTAEAVAQAQLIPNLELRMLTATVRFGISTDTAGGLKLQILPLTVDLGGDVRREAIQEIVVEFRSP